MTDLILSGGGINWTWYLQVRIEGDELKPLAEWRLHNFDDHQGALAHPDKVDGSYRMIENTLEQSRTEGRIVYAIEVETAQGLRRYDVPHFPRFSLAGHPVL